MTYAEAATLLTEAHHAGYAEGVRSAKAIAERRIALLRRVNDEKPRAEHRQRGLEAELIKHMLDALTPDLSTSKDAAPPVAQEG